MSKPENRTRLQITEGPTILSMGDAGLFLQQGGNPIVFSNVEDFMEFVSRLGILAVRLDQMLNPPPDNNNTPDGSETPPA